MAYMLSKRALFLMKKIKQIGNRNSLMERPWRDLKSTTGKNEKYKRMS